MHADAMKRCGLNALVHMANDMVVTATPSQVLKSNGSKYALNEDPVCLTLSEVIKRIAKIFPAGKKSWCS